MSHNIATAKPAPVLPAPPPALPEFEHFKRYWDAGKRCYIARVLPGQHYVTNQKEVIATVLGSCISVCMRDPIKGVGGMNHFLLPEASDSRDPDSGHYGLHAMELLINGIMKNGGQRANFEAKIFGGGEVVHNVTSGVGKRNIDFVVDFLKRENLKLIASDVGGSAARSIFYVPATGQVHVKYITTSQVERITSAESHYLRNLKKQQEKRAKHYQVFRRLAPRRFGRKRPPIQTTLGLSVNRIHGAQPSAPGAATLN